MSFGFRRFTTAAALAMLAACASAPNVPLGTTSRGAPRTIMLAYVPEPQNVAMHDFHGAAMLLGGVLGGGIQGGVDQARAKRLVDVMNGNGIHPGQTLATAFTDTFAASGVALTYRPEEKVRLGADRKTEDYSMLRTDADAILVVWYHTFMVASTAKLSTEFQPLLDVHARLLDGRTRAVLYDKRFSINQNYPIANTVTLPLGSDVKFDGIDDIAARPADLGRSLRLADLQVAQRVALDLGARPVLANGGNGGAVTVTVAPADAVAAAAAPSAEPAALMSGDLPAPPSPQAETHRHIPNGYRRLTGDELAAWRLPETEAVAPSGRKLHVAFQADGTWQARNDDGAHSLGRWRTDRPTNQLCAGANATFQRMQTCYAVYRRGEAWILKSVSSSYVLRHKATAADAAAEPASDDEAE